MYLTKKILLAFFLSFAVSTTAIAAGKIENATLDEIKASIDSTIEISEKALAALENGADKDTVLDLISDAKQKGKEIHATRRAAVYKSKAGTQMKKARSAAKKNDLEKAKEHVIKGVEFYKQLKEAFLETNG